MRGTVGSKPPFDGGKHHVADIRSGNARPRHGHVSDDLAIEGIDDESDANLLAVPADDLQAIRAVSQ